MAFASNRINKGVRKAIHLLRVAYREIAGLSEALLRPHGLSSGLRQIVLDIHTQPITKIGA